MDGIIGWPGEAPRAGGGFVDLSGAKNAPEPDLWSGLADPRSIGLEAILLKFRDYNTEGFPASGPYNVHLSDADEYLPFIGISSGDIRTQGRVFEKKVIRERLTDWFNNPAPRGANS